MNSVASVIGVSVILRKPESGFVERYTLYPKSEVVSVGGTQEIFTGWTPFGFATDSPSPRFAFFETVIDSTGFGEGATAWLKALSTSLYTVEIL